MEPTNINQSFPTDNVKKKEKDSSKSSMCDSSFEEEIDEGNPITLDLERNYELMKRNIEQIASQYRNEQNGVIVFDSNAKPRKFLITLDNFIGSNIKV